MPSTSPKMQHFMGADLARKRAGKKTKTGMSEQQLREFAGSVQQHGSLEDITALEDSTAENCKVVDDAFTHPVHKGYDIEGTFGELDPPAHDGSGAAQFTKGKQSCNRDIGQSIHYGAPIAYHGPDTDYRAEEIDVHQYGSSYDPFPLRDYFKTGDKMRDRTFRMREADEYDEEATPGAIPDAPLESSKAYGVVGYSHDETELEDNRSFDEQREYARGVVKGPIIDAVVKGIDQKKGSKIR